MKLLQDWIEMSSIKNPDKNFITYKDEQISYNQFNTLSENFKNFLVSLGVEKFDRILILTENKLNALIASYGTLKKGAIFSIINTLIKSKSLIKIIEDCSPKIIISDVKHFPLFSGLVDCSIPVARIILDGDPSKIDLEGEKNNLVIFDDFNNIDHKTIYEDLIIDSDIATIIYTSGSTGNPKGVMMSHSAILSACKSINQVLSSNEDDVILNVLPLSFDYGLYQVFLSSLVNSSIVIEDNFLFPNKILGSIEKTGITGFPITPTIGSIIVKKFKNQEMPKTIRYFTSTSQTFPTWVIRGLGDMFPTSEIFSMYGLTECKRVSYLDPSKIFDKPQSVGKSIPNVQTYLLDDNQEIIVKPFTIGELAIRGNNLMLGYWNDREKTDEKIVEGFYFGDRMLLSGDYFYFDNDGDLFFQGRKDNIVKSGGMMISPTEVENVILSIDGVEEIAVIPIDDEYLGQVLKAYISCDVRVSEEKIKIFLTSNIEKYKIPKEFEFLKELPKNPNGKIDRKKLLIL